MELTSGQKALLFSVGVTGSFLSGVGYRVYKNGSLPERYDYTNENLQFRRNAFLLGAAITIGFCFGFTVGNLKDNGSLDEHIENALQGVVGSVIGACFFLSGIKAAQTYFNQYLERPVLASTERLLPRLV